MRAAAKGMGLELGTPTPTSCSLPGQAASRHRGPLASPRPCSRVGLHAVATRIMMGRAVSVPCSLSRPRVCFGPFGIGSVQCFSSLRSPLTRSPSTNAMCTIVAGCKMQNADRARHAGTQAPHPHPHPPGLRVVAAGSRSATSGGKVQHCACYSTSVPTRDTAQIGAAVSVSAGGSCPRSSLHNITIFNFAQNVRARVRTWKSPK